MAYDEDLADRIRELLGGDGAITEKKMFGGLAFLAGGHMAIAVSGQGGLMVRVDPEETDALLDRPGVGPMVMRGRPLDGWVRVEAGAVGSRGELEPWVQRGLRYARSLPPKG
jgi:TfoX/Sxy family transcriptional regulator of competence genes